MSADKTKQNKTKKPIQETRHPDPAFGECCEKQKSDETETAQLRDKCLSHVIKTPIKDGHIVLVLRDRLSGCVQGTGNSEFSARANEVRISLRGLDQVSV